MDAPTGASPPESPSSPPKPIIAAVVHDDAGDDDHEASSVLGAAAAAHKTTHEPKVRYRECRRNFAASTGGYALDGCGEYVPIGEEHVYTCAACQCHRNFHRKEVEGECAYAAMGQQHPPPYWVHTAGTTDLSTSNYGDSQSRAGKEPVRKQTVARKEKGEAV